MKKFSVLKGSAKDYIPDEDIEPALDFLFGCTENMSNFEYKRAERSNDKLLELFDEF